MLTVTVWQELLALMEDIVDVFLELLPALIPESAESFLTNWCLPARGKR